MQYPIVCNDDGLEGIEYIATLLRDAAIEGRQLRLSERSLDVDYAEDEEDEVEY